MDTRSYLVDTAIQKAYDKEYPSYFEKLADKSPLVDRTTTTVGDVIHNLEIYVDNSFTEEDAELLEDISLRRFREIRRETIMREFIALDQDETPEYENVSGNLDILW